MSILTKTARKKFREYCEDRAQFVRSPFSQGDIINMLDTIDALEAHIGALEVDLLQKRKIAGEWQGRAERRRGALAHIDALGRDPRRPALISSDEVIGRILTVITEVEG